MKINKHEYIIAIFVVSLILLAISISYDKQDIVEIKDDSFFIDPERTEYQLTVDLYFVDENSLKSEKRLITYSDGKSIELAVVEELVAGPNNINYEPLCIGNVQVEDAKVNGNICEVNFSANFLYEEFWNEKNSYLYVSSITNTLAQFDNIDQVKILANGQAIKKIVNGVNLESYLFSDDSVIYQEKVTPRGIISEFLNDIGDSRYDLAYDLLTKNSKEMFSFGEFQEYFISYKNDNEGYSDQLYMTTLKDEVYNVSIKYTRNEDADLTNENFVDYFFKDWKVIEEDGVYKIDLEYRVQ